MKAILRVSCAFVLLWISCLVQAQITSTFDIDADGWTCSDNNLSDPQTVNYNSTGGNPGGYVSATKSSSSQPYYWTSPANFGGNISYFSYGQNLSFDIQVNYVSTFHFSSGDVQIRTNSGSILVYTLPSFPAQAPAWSSFTIPLDETAGWRVGSTAGGMATKAQMLQYLSGVHSFRININYRSGVTTFTGAIDNVILEQRSISPSPSVSSLTATSGNPGTSITINGNNFDPVIANNAVYFGGMAGTVTNASATSLTVTIPNGAQYGPLTIINKTTGLAKQSPQPFIPTFNEGGRIIPASLDPKFDINLTGGYGGLSIADIDGDGWNDLVAASEDNSGIGIYRNLGLGGDLTAASFASRVNFLTGGSGTNGAGLRVIDLDGDGKLDMVTSIGRTAFVGSFATFRNTSTPGNLSFEAVEYWDGKSDESPVYTATDIDGDGLPELIGGEGSGGAGQNVWITQNISTPGNIAFNFSLFYFSSALDDAASGATIRDLDNDGKPEFIVVRNFGGAFTIFQNTSTPGIISFGSNFSITQSIGGDINVADFNLDGKNDLAWKNGFSNDDIHIRINTNSGGALAASDFATEIILNGDVTTYGAMSVADINGDGKVDIMATDNGDMGVFENVYTGGVFDASAFVPTYQFQGNGTSTYPAEGLAGDLNGDNKPDIVVGITNTSPNRISIYENNNVHTPVISLSTVSPLKGNIGSTVTITGDHFSTTPTENIVHFGAVKANVLTATKTQLTVTVPAGASIAPVSVTKNQLAARYHLPFVPTFSASVPSFNNTHFGAPVNFTLTTADFDVEVADLDSDSKPDVVVENGSPGPGVFFHNTHTAGAINPGSLTNVGQTNTTASNPRLIDLDGDTRIDIVSANAVARNISTTGTVQFENIVTYGVNSTNLGINDFNLDGKTDFVGANGTNMAVTENWTKTGAFVAGTFPSFSPPVNFPKPATGGGTATADFDNDGFFDIVATNPGTDNVTVWKNNSAYRLSATQFTALPVIAVGDNPGRIYPGDLDVDGKVDLVMYHGTGTTTTMITVLHNQSTASISFNRVDYTIPAAATVAHISDLDGDGRPEIIVTSESTDQFFILKNNSAPGVMNASSFAAAFSTSVNNPRGLTSGDLNLDGKPEIIITAAPNSLLVFENLVPASCVPVSERNALIALYNATNGASWTNNTNWLNVDESTWFGVTVTGCNITQIELDNNNLTGPIPAEIDDLPNLIDLSLAENNLSGAIPIGLSTLPSIINLQLRSNQLTGTIPVELGNITTLHTLNLSDNQLSGTIPGELGNLSALQLLELGGNQLTGTIPSQLENAASLMFLILGRNQLTGSIPISLGNITGLFQLDLSENQLTGSIPPELGNINSLTNLFLHVNQLTGPIPTELGNLVNLEILDIFTNQLSGTLPVELALCTQLRHLEVADNLLTGTLPIAYQSLVNLETFQINGNSFTGPVPVEYLAWSNIKELHLSNNLLDALPTFPPALITILAVENNKLEFGDLESNIGVTGYVYSPQAKLPPGGTLSVNENSPINIPFSTSGTANSYQWFKDGSTVAGATSATFTKTSSIPADAGTYYVEVTSSIVTGLILQSEDYIISINAAPVILTTLITLPIQGETTLDLIPLITTSGSPLDLSSLQVTAAPSSGALASIDANGMLTLDYAGINFSGTEMLSIRACDQSGNCTTQQFEVEVVGDIEVFNALSPNGDNVNEKFIIQYIDVFPDTQNNRVTIYNRWGDVVFEIENYDNNSRVFRGLNKNDKELPSGTYFYKIEFVGGRAAKTGYLSLKK